jgi:hypothetical protein
MINPATHKNSVGDQFRRPAFGRAMAVGSKGALRGRRTAQAHT